MRKINKVDILRIVLVLSLVAGIGMAFGSVGRFIPTHKIEEPVYCGSCHPEEVQELGATTHLAKFADYINQSASKNGAGTPLTAARAISGGCVMCHNFWDNMKWYGVANFAVTPYDGDNPSIANLTPPTDIYGNAVSPYGLGSTEEYVMNVSYASANNATTKSIAADMITIPWMAGLDTYQYTDKTGTTYSRIDYVWSKLSSLSPGPVGFLEYNTKPGGQATSCGKGSAEHGLCHIAMDGVALSFQDKKAQLQQFPANSSINQTPGTFAGTSAGLGTFFEHEMAFTTAQYAAKPVKLCGACHVFKLPPMRWGGEPWAISDINFAENPANNGSINNDPFGFRPSYNDLIGTTTVLSHGHANNQVAFRTPDWAHANVPCIRCHVHAGVNGDTVTDNQAGSSITDPNTGLNPADPSKR